MDVGIREFKARLSDYLRRSQAGEEVRITDRGTPRWKLVPVDEPEDVLARGAREGWISAAGARSRPPLHEPRPFPPLPGRSASRELQEDRGE